jgi:hypothetical protein
MDRSVDRPGQREDRSLLAIFERTPSLAGSGGGSAVFTIATEGGIRANYS